MLKMLFCWLFKGCEYLFMFLFSLYVFVFLCGLVLLRHLGAAQVIPGLKTTSILAIVMLVLASSCSCMYDYLKKD